MHNHNFLVVDTKLIKQFLLVLVVVALLIFPIVSYDLFIPNVSGANTNNFTFKWTAHIGQFTSWSSPVAEDINGDGIYEIFQAGRVSNGIGSVICLNGLTGALIWRKNFTTLSDYHIPVVVGDLRGDGIYEVVQSAGTNTIARYASNGTILWNSTAGSGWSVPAIADVDGNHHPYVYAEDNTAFESHPHVRKLNGTTGVVVASAPISYCCYGGCSIADINDDGIYEVFVTDSGPDHCYDQNLNLLWETGSYTSESHCAVLTNVTGDRKLEVIVLQQDMTAPYDGGIHVYYANGTMVPGMNDGTLGLGCHCQPAVYDIDKDGHVEVLTCYAGTPCAVWDLTTWSQDATLASGSEPPDIANVIGNSDLEIISPEGYEDGLVSIYDSSYAKIATIGSSGHPMYGMNTITQDIDNDGLNELIISGPGAGNITAYDTLALAPTPRVRTDTPYYSERRTNAGVYIPKIGGKCLLNNVYPSNGATNVSVSTIALSINIKEPNGDPIDWTIETCPNIGKRQGAKESNGTKTCPISSLSPRTAYKWYVNATDGTNWKCQTFTFTTGSSSNDTSPPQISSVSLRTSSPLDTVSNFGWENFTNLVTDNVGVSTVFLHITNPDNTITSFPMTKKIGTSTFFSNRSFSLGGTYNYVIQASDMKNNTAVSASNIFWLPSNWDINCDGVCTILDLVMVSNHYGATGRSGWIREDVDNNGVINVLDISLVSDHYS
jgi:hypothetical protein